MVRSAAPERTLHQLAGRSSRVGLPRRLHRHSGAFPHTLNNAVVPKDFTEGITPPHAFGEND